MGKSPADYRASRNPDHPHTSIWKETPCKAFDEPYTYSAAIVARVWGGRDSHPYRSTTWRYTSFHLLRFKPTPPGFKGTESYYLIALVYDHVPPSRLFRVDTIQTHSQAILEHGYRVVAKPTQGAQIINVLIATRAAIGYVLNGRCRGLAEKAKSIVIG
jgi:hypothetical protein